MDTRLYPLDKTGIARAQQAMTKYHYRHSPVDPRCSVEGYEIELVNFGFAGYFLFGRPEATRCGDWYGSVEDVRAGRCEVTRWQVLNLARVWINPDFQPGGEHWRIWTLSRVYHLPGFWDRKGVWRSTLASEAIRMAAERIGFDYLINRPPCFLDEPYEIRWLLSYCDPAFHKGTIYRASGFRLYRTNGDGLMTWRLRLPALTPEQDRAVRDASALDARARKYRAQRAQISLPLGNCDL